MLCPCKSRARKGLAVRMLVVHGRSDGDCEDRRAFPRRQQSVLSRTGCGATSTDVSGSGSWQGTRSEQEQRQSWRHARLGGCSVAAQCGRELLAAFDVEFPVAVGEVHLDGAQGDEEGLRDLFV